MNEFTMKKEGFADHDERVLASLAHGSIVLGIFTSGIGGIFAALIIWLSQREKSTYVAYQSLQAMIYQIIVLFVTVIAFTLYGVLLTLMIVPPMMINPELYQYSPPPSLWLGMSLLIFPCGLWLGTVLYGIWGAIRCMSGSDFQYIGLSRFMEKGE